VIVSGVKDGKHITVALSVDCKGLISCEQIASLDGVQVNKGVSHQDKVLLQCGANLSLFEISTTDRSLSLTPIQTMNLSDDEHLLGISNGLVSIHSGKSIRTLHITSVMQFKTLNSQD